jgi:hypothetical protein
MGLSGMPVLPLPELPPEDSALTRYYGALSRYFQTNGKPNPMEIGRVPGMTNDGNEAADGSYIGTSMVIIVFVVLPILGVWLLRYHRASPSTRQSRARLPLDRNSHRNR